MKRRLVAVDTAPMADDSIVPRGRDDVVTRTIDDETVILDQARGLIHRLNPTAGLIWNHCDGSSAVADIVWTLGRMFEIDPTTARRDVLSTVRLLGRLGLVELDGRDAVDGVPGES